MSKRKISIKKRSLCSVTNIKALEKEFGKTSSVVKQIKRKCGRR